RPEQGASSPRERDYFDYFDSNIRTFVHRVFDACPATYFIAKRMGAPLHGSAVVVPHRGNPRRDQPRTDFVDPPRPAAQRERPRHATHVGLQDGSPPPRCAPRERLRDDPRGRGLRDPVLALSETSGPLRRLPGDLASDRPSVGGKIDLVHADAPPQRGRARGILHLAPRVLALTSRRCGQIPLPPLPDRYRGPELSANGEDGARSLGNRIRPLAARVGPVGYLHRRAGDGPP